MDAPGELATAQLFLGMLVTYRAVKFVAWETMLLHPTCEAGESLMVAHRYDPHVASTPGSLKPWYQVTAGRTGID